MKNFYFLHKFMLGAAGMMLTISGALAQNSNFNPVNVNANALNAKHHAGAAKASTPVFENDGTPANDAALGKVSAKSVSLPDIPRVKTHGRHTVSHGPVGPQKYPSNAQQEIKEPR
jgi:hypothetical protein